MPITYFVHNSDDPETSHMKLQFLTEGFFLGLATGHICFATCGPIYSPYLILRKNDLLRSSFSILKISLGRFVSSVLVGIAAGLFGRTISTINRSYFTIAAYILFSIFLIASAFRARNREKGCTLSRWTRFSDSPLLLGLVTGVSFCPAFLIALTRAVDLSGPASGALLFTGFFSGTNIFLLPLAVFGVIGNNKTARKIAFVCSLAVGGWFILQAGISAKNLYLEPKYTISENDRSIINLLDNTRMFILSDETARFVMVKDVLEKNRKGNVLLVDKVNKLQDTGYILVDPAWQNKVDRSVSSLKNRNRFVIILPAPENNSIYSERYMERLLSFFRTRYFKCDTLSGSLFDMSRFFNK